MHEGGRAGHQPDGGRHLHHIRQRLEPTERSPGLYIHIMGFIVCNLMFNRTTYRGSKLFSIQKTFENRFVYLVIGSVISVRNILKLFSCEKKGLVGTPRDFYLTRFPVWRIRDVYPGSRFLPIPDPGSKNSNKREGWKKIVVITFYVATNFTKLKIILVLKC